MMLAGRRKTAAYYTRPAIDKIVEGILLLVEEAGRKKIFITQYDIVKSFFLADRAHLNRFGRPISFDNYVAMKHGPVPSAIYDILKNNAQSKAMLHGNPPWHRRNAPELGRGCFSYERPARHFNEDFLSPSDTEHLIAALQTVKTLGFKQVRKLTHEDPAYLDAWEDTGPENSAYPMSYTLFYEAPDEEKAQDLVLISQHI